MSESASQRSGDASETSSQAADRALLKRRNRNRDDVQGEEDDLLEQRKSLQEGVFAAMYLLSRSKSVDSWQFPIIKIVLEALIPFLVIFNPTNGWDIETSNPVWQVVRWVLPRSPVARIWGYDVYIRIFYAIVAVVYLAVGCLAALTFAMRKQEHSKLLMKFARFLQLFTEVVFTLAYMSVFDYMVFLFNCEWVTHDGSHLHTYFTSVQCFQTPHLIHMVVAGVTAVVFFFSTALMLVAGCDLNPVAQGIMASPAAVTRLKVLVLKALYVIVINILGSLKKAQGVAVTVCAVVITFLNLSRLPFLRYYINFFWVGGWAAVSYTCGVYCYFMFQSHKDEHDVAHFMAQLVLYGVFPAAATGAVATWLWFLYRMYPARKFTKVDLSTKLKKVHEFSSADDVEIIARTMRHFDSDGTILEDAAQVGDTIIKCGMAVFPNNVGLLILYANFLMEVKRDGPAARTQLQLALKGGPSLVQRYEVFSTIENSKRLKDGQEGQLDLQSYVEFKRNYRAVVRVHKAALSAQREYWQLMQRSSVRVAAIEAHVREMDEAADTAHQVYKRVLERYPNNGKLLRCYGKFLEDVRNDPAAAARVYTEAARNGGGDGLLSLDLQVTGNDKPEFLTSMDLHEDACVVINAEGTILMVNTCITALLGYPKTELEGANVSVMMPQPFAGRHPSYLARYVGGGEPHILDTVRDVVALHKERHVFPLQLCVTKLSGVGTDAIFLGVLRPQPLDSRNLRAWVAPNGVILCTDPQFASLTGVMSEDMVGAHIQSMCTDIEAVEALLELCREAPYEALVAGTIVRHFAIVHKHLPPVPVEVKVTPGGTDTQRIFVLNAHRTDGVTNGMMVVNAKGALTFATWDVAALLGYPLKKFLHMKLEQLLPLPFAAMHAKYLKDHSAFVPPTSCRAGRVVDLVNSNGANVPVRLQVFTQDDSITGQTKHIVQVHKVDPATVHFDKRIVLLVTTDGLVLSVDQPESTLFGFPASACVGSNLADCIDVFAEWRTKAGNHQMELLLLSLLDREVETPGTSWRVKVHSPITDDSLPNIDPSAPPRQAAGRSACLQTELVDASEHTDLSADTASTLTKIVLWRRDLLTGVVELDNRLMLRKVDVGTGLIVGLPPSALLRKPLYKVLNIPREISWEELMKDKRKKSALKGASGPSVSATRSFEGAHPDGGTMKIFVQGVTAGGSGRIFATFHPDTAFQGARANIYRALGLEALIHDKEEKAAARASEGGYHPAAAAAPAPVPAAAPAPAAAATASGGKHGDARTRQPPRDGGKPAPDDVRDPALLGRLSGGGATPPDVEAGGGDRATSGGQAVQGGGQAEKAAAVGCGEPEPPAATEKAAPAAAEAAAAAVPRRSKGLQEVEDEEQSSNDNDSDDEDLNEYDWDGERDRRSVGERSDGDASLSVAHGNAGGGASGVRRTRTGGAGAAGSDGGDPDHLHLTAHNQSEFVAQWVRTLAKQMTGQPDPAGDRDAIPPSRGVSRTLSQQPARQPSRLASGLLGGNPVRKPSNQSGAGLPGGGASPSFPRRRSSDASGGGGGFGGGDEVTGTSAAESPELGAAQRGNTMTGGSRRKLELAPVEEEEEEAEEEEEDGRERQARTSGDGGGSNRGGGGRRRVVVTAGGGAKLDDLPDEAPNSRSASDNEGASSVGDDDEATSQGLGPSMTDASSAVDVDLATDARRARLLKKLCKLFSGPQLTEPLLRMRNYTWLLLGGMLITHVVIYVILISLIDGQFSNVREVHRLALAADRCQLATVKVVASEFCARPDVAPMSICEVSLSDHLSDLSSALRDLEAYHQTTYLGSSTVPRKIKEPTAYYLWTSPTSMYRAYFDTQVPVWVNETAGVWQVGNRFIATAREILYWGKTLNGSIAGLRAFKFVVANGPWSVFAGYTGSLDYLVNYAWQEVSQLQKALIIMLVVEAAGVQLACVLYELVLVRGLERARLGGLLTSLAIPGPMLRVLASRPIVIVEDSDDEDGDDEDAAGDGAAGGGTGGPAKSGVTSAEDTDEDGGDTVAAVVPAAGAGAAGAATAGGNATRRYRRMSMDMVVPPPGAALPGGAMPPYYVGGADEGRGGAGNIRRSIDALPYNGPLPGRGADGSMHFAPGVLSGHVAPVDVASLASGTSGGGGVLISGRRGSVSGVKEAGGGRLVVNGKELVPSYRNTIRFMVPLLLWEVALVVVGAVSYLRLEGMQGPLAALNMASHVIYRYTRIRVIALLLVTSQGAPATMGFYRDVLKTELANLQSEYDTLMYGGMAVTQVGSVFQKPVPAATFESSSFSNNFFRQERCFRWDQSKCYTPDSPYYEVTHHGLDVMLRRIISEMTLLASDDDADAVYNGTRYTTMYKVGTKDLYEGLQSSAQLFVDFSISRYNSIKLLQTIMLAVTVVFFLGYGLLLLRPYTAAVEREAMRLAGLLSHVPAEMDVAGHVRQVLRAHTKLHHRGHPRKLALTHGSHGSPRRTSENGAGAPWAGGGGGGGWAAIRTSASGGLSSTAPSSSPPSAAGRRV